MEDSDTVQRAPTITMDGLAGRAPREQAPPEGASNDAPGEHTALPREEVTELVKVTPPGLDRVVSHRPSSRSGPEVSDVDLALVTPRSGQKRRRPCSSSPQPVVTLRARKRSIQP